MTSHTWIDHALCVRFPRFPWTADHHLVNAREEDLMRRVCALCPVLAECREFALSEQVSAGFWAGHRRDTAENPDLVEEPRRAA